MGIIIYKFKKKPLIYTFIFICFITSIIFVYHNYGFYERPIAKVIQTDLEDSTDITDIHDNNDRIFTQQIIAEIKNGEEKGQLIHLTNKYSLSRANDQPYQKGNEVFVSFEKNTIENPQLTGNITDVKRDKYIVIVAWIFIFTLLIVGKKQGLFASISLAVNILLLSYALDIYVRTDLNLLWICGITVILFTIISLLLVNGFNEKTYTAIIATLLGTFSSLLITYFAIWIASENGLYYEEMQYLTRPYRLIFLAGLFIGSLGAVMDVAISLSSATFELYNKNNDISVKALKASGMEIGKDIMGTMTNILFFAYISGSIPMLILYLKNYSPLGFTLSINLSLELARALAGGIGIVLTIPIGLYTSIFFIKRKRENS
ncbi:MULTISPECIES: YibE/F family protein [Bacillaceae]|uniref:YibE/F family protein n=1 Tax=Bacillaceae TaxID=186817 RepID=UPI000621051B|nr:MULTISPECIES: YibE/F family protein [Bacillaceae]KKE79665.1 yibE/F-like family protein [Bacilli bacterium VT-13-104]PZD89620.1 YibE/F family protein [Bacilli bacterium]MED4474707.1 YibE/F family protein [Oceanobacillus caeni]PZD91142.1 YibE/F family protein [Bacilli bacterium]PZD92689.1 YibE/F family protein [Bacilli bacterium]